MASDGNNAIDLRSGAVISAVIPTFRRPRLLQRAICSALEQGDVARVMVFDNCSGDETADVVANLARDNHGLRYHAHDTNIGAHANFEYGVRSVETPFFSILSDDDYLLPGFYDRALAGLAAHPEAMFWIGMTLNVGEDGLIWDARLDRWPREGLYYPPMGAMAMTGGTAPTWTGMVFRREVLDLAGFIDLEALGPADIDYAIRLGARFPFVFEKVPAAVFTLNPQGFSSTEPLSSFWPGWQKMLHNVRELPGLSVVQREQLFAAIDGDARRMLFRRGANALASGRIEFARDAATALTAHCGSSTQAAALRALAFACSRIPGAQAAVSWLYGTAERRIIRSRPHLQRAYGHLLRSA